ncbi:hypothetical protein HWV62_31746 [Athelia sp. TMB]|nr:hypothetical protein HWV62_31746 [Athelia sp. TMB]
MPTDRAVRFMVTWEAVEHKGEGQYDTAYLDYVYELLSLLPQYGMTCFVNLHQDVWSRYSGGSGAPAWTMEAVGFDLHALHESGAAWLLGVKGGGHVPEERGLWPYMFDVVAAKLGSLDGVLGFEIMNEPHRGYIDVPSLHGWDYNTDLHLAYVPSPFQSFMLGAGHPTEIPFWTRSFPFPTRQTSHGIQNKEGRKVWRADGPTEGKCIWEMHGVWAWDKQKNEGVVLRESYFSKDPISGRKIDWYTDFYYPFLKRWTERIRKVSPSDKLVFVEPIPNEFCPPSWTKNKLSNMVFAPHWYDLDGLFRKAFGDFTVNVQGLSRGMFVLKALYWGQQGARENFSLQIRNIVEASYRSLGEVPVVIGECGIPMDMNKGEAFSSDKWHWQNRMMDAMMTGLERSLVSFNLWNYNPDNTDGEGDFWNGENFSWFSRRRGLPASLLYFEQTAVSLDNGARILPSIVRPYPAKTAGIPVSFQYEMTTGQFTYEWANPASSDAVIDGAPTIAGAPRTGRSAIASKETEIFLPSLLTRDRKVLVEGLGPNDKFAHDESRQTLFVLSHDTQPGLSHKITVSLQPPLNPLFEVNSFWEDWGPQLFSGFMLVVGIIAFYILMKFVN